MTKQKKTRKIAVRRAIKKNDPRLTVNLTSEQKEKMKKKLADKEKTRKGEDHRKVAKFEGMRLVHDTKAASHLYFRYNTQLGPPYRILIDTNFINFSLQNKLDIFNAMMDCLLAKCIPIITDCVMAELEKLGPKYRIALRIAKDPRIERYPCSHKGNYADDCLVTRAQEHKCFIVATCDRDLKRRIRKIPGVPIMYIAQRRFSIERFPDANDAPEH